MWIGEGIGNLYDYYECNAYVGVGLPGTGARIYGSPPGLAGVYVGIFQPCRHRKGVPEAWDKYVGWGKEVEMMGCFACRYGICSLALQYQFQIYFPERRKQPQHLLGLPVCHFIHGTAVKWKYASFHLHGLSYAACSSSCRLFSLHGLFCGMHSNTCSSSFLHGFFCALYSSFCSP